METRPAVEPRLSVLEAQDKAGIDTGCVSILMETLAARAAQGFWWSSGSPVGQLSAVNRVYTLYTPRGSSAKVEFRLGSNSSVRCHILKAVTRSYHWLFCRGLPSVTCILPVTYSYMCSNFMGYG